MKDNELLRKFMDYVEKEFGDKIKTEESDTPDSFETIWGVSFIEEDKIKQSNQKGDLRC